MLVAAPEDLVPELRAALPGVHVGWLPFDVLIPTCDLVIHHGGGVTCMTATNADVPQLFVPTLAHTIPLGRRMADHGAAITLVGEEAGTDNLLGACKSLLSDPAYRKRARELAREIGTLPSPAEVVGVLEELRIGHRAPG